MNTGKILWWLQASAPAAMGFETVFMNFVHPRTMKITTDVMPAEAGIQTPPHLGSRFRGNDNQSVLDDAIF